MSIISLVLWNKSLENILFDLIKPVHNNNFAIIFLAHIPQNIIVNNIILFLALIGRYPIYYAFLIPAQVLFVFDIVLSQLMQQVIV